MLKIWRRLKTVGKSRDSKERNKGRNKERKDKNYKIKLGRGKDNGKLSKDNFKDKSKKKRDKKINSNTSVMNYKKISKDLILILNN